MEFKNKVVLISGAGSGIGKVVSQSFADKGARVALLGRTAAKLEATAARLPAGQTLLLPAHHEDPREAADAVGTCLKSFGRIDVLVNNAGAFNFGNLGETSFEEWSKAIAVNLTGPYVLTRASLPALRETRGSIVNVSSSLGLQPVAGTASYSVAKAGVNMLTRTLALEESSHGVRANAVCPGVVDTPIHEARVGQEPGAIQDFLQQMAGLHPMGRVGTPEDIAALVLFLASDAASWLTGAVIPIDGGISLT